MESTFKVHFWRISEKRLGFEKEKMCLPNTKNWIVSRERERVVLKTGTGGFFFKWWMLPETVLLLQCIWWYLQCPSVVSPTNNKTGLKQVLWLHCTITNCLNYNKIACFLFVQWNFLRVRKKASLGFPGAKITIPDM